MGLISFLVLQLVLVLLVLVVVAVGRGMLFHPGFNNMDKSLIMNISNKISRNALYLKKPHTTAESNTD